MTGTQKINMIALGVVALFLLTRPSVLNLILSLLLGGVIPGTNFALPSWTMLGIYLLLMTAVLTRSYERSHERKS